MNWLKKIINLILPNDQISEFIENATTYEILNKVEKANTSDLPKSFLASVSYRNELVKKAIKLLKYYGNEKVAKLLGEILANEIKNFLEEFGIMENIEKPILTIVPISKERLKERGFCQTKILGNKIMKNGFENVLEWRPDLILKIKDVKSQVKTRNKIERLRNLKGCFKVINQKNVFKRNIIVIDDVITTGATAEEITKTLKKAGAKKVFFFAIAH